MHAERIRSAGLSARTATFIAARHITAICLARGQHQHAGAARDRLTRPNCGATGRTPMLQREPSRPR